MHTSYYFSIVNGEGCQVIEKWVFFFFFFFIYLLLAVLHATNYE